VCGYKPQQSADNVQHRAIRYFLGVHRHAPIAAITGEVGWLPCRYRRWINMLRYWNRLNTMNSTRLTKHIFENYYSLCKNKSWCSEVKTILTTINLADNYNTKAIVDLQLAKSRIANYYKQLWTTTVQSSPKLRFYRHFKTEYDTEKYVLLNLAKNERSIMAQYRCGILPIRIETGRYVNEQLDDRICTICHSGQIESEKHFLLECCAYDELRTDTYGQLFENIEFMNKQDDDKVVLLLKTYTRKTAKFLVKAFLRRRSMLYA